MVLRKAANFLPGNLKNRVKKAYYRNRHWAHPSLKRFGTVLDLHYWVSDGNLDTLLLLQNYYSVLYPDLDTTAEGEIILYDKDGQLLGKHTFTVPRYGCAKFRASGLKDELGAPLEDTFGTLEVNLHIPSSVLDQIQDQKSVYFWDRFYIGYTNNSGQTCFVHGVDKTHICPEDGSFPAERWYPMPKEYEWAPEIPIDIEDYQKFSVVLLNRSGRTATTILLLSDSEDKSLSWTQQIPANGVRRFELTQADTVGLETHELRIRVKGMATQYGRPIVFKEFANGSISAMHC